MTKVQKSLRTFAVSLALCAGAASPSLAVNALVARLPSRDAAVMGSVDLAAIRRSSVVDPKSWQEHAMPEDVAGTAALLKAAGIDVRRDLDEIAFAMTPDKDGKKDAGAFAFLARGRFDRVKVRKAALARGGVATRLGSMDAIRLPSKDELSANGKAYLAFVDDLLAVGTQDALKAMQSSDSGAGALSARASSDIPADAAMWIVGDLTRMTQGAAAEASPFPMASQLQRIALWGLFSNALELHAVADAANAQVAAQIGGMAQLAAGMLPASASGEASPLAGLKVTVDNSRVTASLSLTKAQLAKLDEDEKPAVKTPTSG